MSHTVRGSWDRQWWKSWSLKRCSDCWLWRGMCSMFRCHGHSIPSLLLFSSICFAELGIAAALAARWQTARSQAVLQYHRHKCAHRDTFEEHTHMAPKYACKQSNPQFQLAIFTQVWMVVLLLLWWESQWEETSTFLEFRWVLTFLSFAYTYAVWFGLPFTASIHQGTCLQMWS